MNETKTVERRVLEILKDNPQTRFDDMLLILCYYDRFSWIDVDDMPFKFVVQNYKSYGMPCFETIRRARQRLQSCFPELSRRAKPAEQDGVLIVINFS